MTFDELQNALKIMSLGERATLAEIRMRHRDLVKKYHPDSGFSGDPDRIRQINAAHRLLSEYVGNYRFSFTEEEFCQQNPEEWVRRQFMSDPLWGKR